MGDGNNPINLEELNSNIRALPLTDCPLECRNFHKYNLYKNPELSQGHKFWATVGFDGTNESGNNQQNRLDAFSVSSEGQGIFAWMQNGKDGKIEASISTINGADIRHLEAITEEEYERRMQKISKVICSLAEEIQPRQ